MKQSMLLMFLASLMLLPAPGQAAVLENRDLEDYQYETSEGGEVPHTLGTIYAESVQSDICVDGCRLKLLKTGQTITVGPDDYIIISDGVMRRKKEVSGWSERNSPHGLASWKGERR
jgi:hypothetical protein